MEELTKAQQERAAFEAAMGKLHPEWSFASDGCGGYHAHYTESAWQAWQARSLSSGVAASPPQPQVPEEVAHAARLFVAAGYRGPLHMARTVFDWVHSLATAPQQPTEGGVRVPSPERDDLLDTLALVRDLSSTEWQSEDGKRHAATDNQGRRFHFISEDVMQAVREVLSTEAQGGSNHG